MLQFAYQNKSFAKLEEERQFLSKQMAEVPLSSMSPKQLGDNARAVTQQMRNYLHSYQLQDQQLYLTLYDRLQGTFGATASQAEILKYRKNADKQRAAFTGKYEQGAKKLIAQANLLRGEL